VWAGTQHAADLSLAGPVMPNANIESRQFRRAMGKFATGVTVVSYIRDNEPAAMTANAFMSLSMDPPMVLIAARNPSRFASAVSAGEHIGISFLREEQESLSSHFGGRSNPQLSSPFRLDLEVPVIEGALVQIVAKVHSVFPGGDHLIYTAEVEWLEEADGRPLLFFSGKYKQLHALDPLECWKDYSDFL
jgi:flavin reductase (DIM6/NTAB) family NADH-FMN oxidoreductase RutF